jgi:hypothetical protein
MYALTASTWKNQLDMFLFSAQLMGGGVLLWLLYWRNAFTPTALPSGDYWGGLAAV